MTIEKTFQGAYIISGYYKGHYVKRQYLGYTKKEAVSMFREYVRNYDPYKR